MPTDGAGVYTLPSGYLATLGQVIQPSQHNQPLEDVAAGLTNRLTRNGSGSMTADLNFGGNRGTNIAAASAGTDAVQLNQADARYAALSAAETTIASASTVDLATAANYRVAVTGTTTITSFGAGLNQNRQVRFAASLTITHNATTLICPNGANIITGAGDVAICQSDGSGNWRVVQYFRAGVDGVSVTWTDIASAATMDVGAVASENLRVTGTTTVTSLGTAASGVTRTLRAASGFQLTHSANIVCPSAVSLALLADDFVRVSSLGGGVWHVTDARVLATTTAPGQMSAADKTALDSAFGYRFRAAANFSAIPLSGTYSRTGTLVTVTMTAHGMTTGQVVNLDFTTGTATDGTYTVTVTGVNEFTVTDASSGATSGNVTRQIFIRSSFNVSSITDNGFGDATVNFTSAMPDANIVALVTAGQSATSIFTDIGGLAAPTSTTVRVGTRNGSGTLTDMTFVSVAVFR